MFTAERTGPGPAVRTLGALAAVAGATLAWPGSSQTSSNCRDGCAVAAGAGTLRAVVSQGGVVDVHLRIDGGAQRNHRMTRTGEQWAYDVTGLGPTTPVAISHTIIDGGIGRTTPWRTYTLAALTPAPPSAGEGALVFREAESFASMSGVAVEPSSDAGGGQGVGWIDAGDWMAYSAVTFPETGRYRVEYRVASPSGARLSLDLNAGRIPLGAVAIPATGGWQAWTTVSHVVDVTAGTYNLGVFAAQGGWNFNWFRITRVAGGGPVTPPPPTPGTIEPLYGASTILEPAGRIQQGNRLITRFADRARDRHAKETQFQAYDHYLSFYWEHRTAGIEIIEDQRPDGTASIRMNVRTQWRLNDREAENRWFYRGIGTVAEFCDNGTMMVVDTFNYWKERTLNCRTGQPIRRGDKLEFEISQFLDPSVPRGRAPYYGTTFLYIVGEGIVPWDVQPGPFSTPMFSGGTKDSVKVPERAWLGGRTTLAQMTSGEPDNHFLQMATNLNYHNGQPFVQGRRVHHTSFLSGLHDEHAENGVFPELVGRAGPRYVNERCTACHVRNGRAAPAAPGVPLDTWVVNVGDIQGNPHPAMGRVLQPKANGGAASEGTVVIAGWTEANGLRAPTYRFSNGTPPRFSARIAPQLVGMGLLEAVPESTVLAMEDPNDANGDGISGRANRVPDPVTGQTRLGRFGAKAAKISVRHQVASALNRDMGVTTSVMPSPDCGSGQTDCGPSGVELADVHLDHLVKYIALLGVRPQRNSEDPAVQRGEAHFGAAGCAACHRPTMQTSPHHPLAELRDQTIRPYTDLLLHDMGPGLADSLGEGEASGSEWRTAPLWGLGLSACVTGGTTNAPQGQQVCTPVHSYLHDGRARTIEEAILWHGGEAEASRNAYRALSATQKQELLRFLESL